MNILLTGGAGYIGTHTLVELYHTGHTAVVVDNLCNSHPGALRQVASLIPQADIPFYRIDIRDRVAMERIFTTHHIDACIHFAGLKAVGESVVKPLEYYDNNLSGTLTLLDVMRQHGCHNLIFSSSATVYGEPDEMPITERCPKGICTNPYGWTKSMIEQILTDLQQSDPTWHIVILRYFNPVGAHPSGQIGEAPGGTPNNLMPYITQVAAGLRPQLNIFGNDYPTPDGTGIRDYIHIVDLAAGHVAALQRLFPSCSPTPADSPTLPLIYNLGTGRGYSVLELVQAFERVNHIHIPYTIVPRRPGDIAVCYSDPTKALHELGWKAQLTLDDMVRDSWHWQQLHPHGYGQ